MRGKENLPLADMHSMRKLLFRFMTFIAALWGLEQINLPSLILGIGILMAVVSAMHVLVTPENDF